jgi:hypothetical protein
VNTALFRRRFDRGDGFGGGGGSGVTPLFKYTPGDSLAGWTTARAGSATYYDVNGVVQTALTGVMRDSHYLAGNRGWLLEPAGANAATGPRDLTNAGWTKTLCTIGGSTTAADGSTITTNGIIANAGTVAAVVVDAAGYAWTASTPQAWACIGKPGNKSQLFITTTRKDGTTIETSWVNLSTGVVGTKAAGHTVQTRLLANGNYRVELGLASSGVGAVGATVAFGPADADNTLTVTGDGATVNCYVDWVQVEPDHAWPTSPIIGASRVADSPPTRAHGSTPQARTLYVKATMLVSNPTSGTNPNFDFASIGGVGGANDQYLRYAVALSLVRAQMDNNSSFVAAGASYTTATSGDVLEIRGASDITTAITGGLTVNGGAETTATSAASAAFQAGYTGANYVLMNGGNGPIHILSFKDILGTQSMATCRSA